MASEKDVKPGDGPRRPTPTHPPYAEVLYMYIFLHCILSMQHECPCIHNACNFLSCFVLFFPSTDNMLGLIGRWLLLRSYRSARKADHQCLRYQATFKPTMQVFQADMIGCCNSTWTITPQMDYSWLVDLATIVLVWRVAINSRMATARQQQHPTNRRHNPDSRNVRWNGSWRRRSSGKRSGKY